MLLELQDRLKTLIEADGYFAGICVITERRGDINTLIATALSKIKFAVVVATAAGESDSNQDEAVWTERLQIAVFQMPVTDDERETRNAVVAIEKIIQAVHGQPVEVDSEGPDVFTCLSHQPGENTGMPSHLINVTTRVQLTNP